MKRKICFITGTRAEYGLLRQLILSTSKDKSLISQIIVTGSHLSRDHGLTYKEIEADGLVITNKVNLKIKSDSSQEIINSMSEGLKGFSKALSIFRLQCSVKNTCWIRIIGRKFTKNNQFDYL